MFGRGYPMNLAPSTQARKRASRGGLILLLVWLLLPALHLWQESGAAAHKHNDASCSLCQIALHGVALTAEGPVQVQAASCIRAEPPAIAPETIVQSPDIREHSARGPPST